MTLSLRLRKKCAKQSVLSHLPTLYDEMWAMVEMGKKCEEHHPVMLQNKTEARVCWAKKRYHLFIVLKAL